MFFKKVLIFFCITGLISPGYTQTLTQNTPTTTPPTSSPSKSISQEQCGKDSYSHMTWDTLLNRCVNSKEIEEIKNQISQCDSIQNAEEKVKCTLRNAENSLQTQLEKNNCENESSEEKKKACAQGLLDKKDAGALMNRGVVSGITSSVLSIFTLVFAIVAGTGKIPPNTTRSSCASAWVAFSISAGALLFEILIRSIAGGLTADLEKKFKESQGHHDLKDNMGQALDQKAKNSSDTYTKQLNSLKYLKYQQELSRDVSLSSAIAYGLFAAGFLGVAIWMTAEAAAGNMTCLTPDATAAKLVATDPISATIKTLKATGVGEIIILYMAAVLYGVLIGFSSSDKIQLDANLKTTEELIEKMKKNQAHACIGKENNLEDPACYCYKDGKKNLERTNSQTCQQQWSFDDKPLHQGEDLNKVRDDGPCLNNDQKIVACKECRNNNSCKEYTFQNFTIPNSNNTIPLSNLNGFLSSLARGNIPTGSSSFNAGDLFKKAFDAKNKDLPALVDKINNNLQQENKPLLPKTTEWNKSFASGIQQGLKDSGNSIEGLKNHLDDFFSNALGEDKNKKDNKSLDSSSLKYKSGEGINAAQLQKEGNSPWNSSSSGRQISSDKTLALPEGKSSQQGSQEGNKKEDSSLFERLKKNYEPAYPILFPKK